MGDSFKSEIPYIAKPEVSALLAAVDTSFGIFSGGYNQSKMKEIFGGIYIDTVDGVEQEPFIDEFVQENSRVTQYFIDYLYSSQTFHLGFGVDRTNVHKLIYTPLGDTYLMLSSDLIVFMELNAGGLGKNLSLPPYMEANRLDPI